MPDTNWLSPHTNQVRPYELVLSSEAVYRGLIVEQLSIAKQYLKQTTNDELSAYLYTLSQQLQISNKAEDASDQDPFLQKRLHTSDGKRKEPTDLCFQAHEESAAEILRVVRIALECRIIPDIVIDWQKVRDLLRFETAKWVLYQPDPDVVGQQRDVEMQDAR